MNDTLEITDVALTLGETNFAFDLVCPASSTTALIGPSGSGKTTLLNLIAGFLTPQGGEIRAMGTTLNAMPPDRRPVSMVFQDHNLFPHLTAGQNVALGLSATARPDANHPQVLEALSNVGLAGKAERYPGKLSGGERQRVAIARCLLRDRQILLLDEPFAALGPALRQNMLALIGRLRDERDLTIILVTHSPTDAAALADRVAYLDAGRVIVSGPTQDILSDTRLEGYLGNWGMKNHSVVALGGNV
jgi:thiamine transport system ATP-binding protein